MGKNYLKISFLKEGMVKGIPNDEDKDSDPEDDEKEDSKSKKNPEIDWFFMCSNNSERNTLMSKIHCNTKNIQIMQNQPNLKEKEESEEARIIHEWLEEKEKEGEHIYSNRKQYSKAHINLNDNSDITDDEEKTDLDETEKSGEVTESLVTSFDEENNSPKIEGLNDIGGKVENP